MRLERAPFDVWTRDSLARSLGLSSASPEPILTKLVDARIVRRRTTRSPSSRSPVTSRASVRRPTSASSSASPSISLRSASRSSHARPAGRRVRAARRAARRDRGVRVGVAAERDDRSQPCLERPGLGQRPERDPGREQHEALVGSVDRPLDAGGPDQVLELLGALAVLTAAEAPDTAAARDRRRGRGTRPRASPRGTPSGSVRPRA